jgi:hypothetical protein
LARAAALESGGLKLAFLAPDGEIIRKSDYPRLTEIPSNGLVHFETQRGPKRKCTIIALVRLSRTARQPSHALVTNYF